eukprot:scaffold1050_cov130-Isochrysis_galbana.AAC.6
MDASLATAIGWLIGQSLGPARLQGRPEGRRRETPPGVTRHTREYATGAARPKLLARAQPG